MTWPVLCPAVNVVLFLPLVIPFKLWSFLSCACIVFIDIRRYKLRISGCSWKRDLCLDGCLKVVILRLDVRLRTVMDHTCSRKSKLVLKSVCRSTFLFHVCSIWPRMMSSVSLTSMPLDYSIYNALI